MNKSYGEWKGIKGHSSNDFKFAVKSSSDTNSSKSSKSKQEKIAEREKFPATTLPSTKTKRQRDPVTLQIALVPNYRSKPRTT